MNQLLIVKLNKTRFQKSIPITHNPMSRTRYKVVRHNCVQYEEVDASVSTPLVLRVGDAVLFSDETPPDEFGYLITYGLAVCEQSLSIRYVS